MRGEYHMDMETEARVCLHSQGNPGDSRSCKRQGKFSLRGFTRNMFLSNFDFRY
jgi:hypothetical protein